MTISPEQAAVFEDLSSGRNVLVTGQAGTGKSTILNLARSQSSGQLAVTASTGIAALNVRGSTLHSFAGIGKGEEPGINLGLAILAKRGNAFRNITECQALAIDEISMISGELFDKLDTVFRVVRGNHKPFGGIQLLLFGDFLQLPPVSKYGDNNLFAFESNAWKAAGVSTRQLTKVFRQDNQAFVDALGRIRIGDTSHPSFAMIEERNLAIPPDDGIKPVIIHTHNDHVEQINNAELDRIPGAESRIPAIERGTPYGLERLESDCLAPSNLRLKEGSQVMLLANLDISLGLVNGRLGVVECVNANSVDVQFGDIIASMERYKWEIKSEGTVIASREQFPLRLAYALSVHKTQGMTLDRILCHLSGSFECGQAYVALSRVKTLEGLYLRGFSAAAVKVNARAKMFYEASRLAA